MQSHIGCINGFLFFRKVLEYDYNPSKKYVYLDAEQALKILGEISIKQFRVMKI